MAEHRHPRRVVIAACVLVVVSLGACASSGSRSARPATANSTSQVVVASFNFPESELLAEIYAQALAAAGVPVRTQLDLGTRELVLPAFQEGFVDVVPEYIGSALQAIDPGATTDVSSPSEVAARLSVALRPWRGQVLSPSPAEDQNGFAVRAVMAEKYGLRAVRDLHKFGPGLTLTGPPECPSRAYCLIGLERTYGLHVRQFVALDTEGQRVTALNQGVANVALMFSTDADLATGELVFLADDRQLQPPDNVAPLVRDAAVAHFGERLVRTLDNVSAHLSTRELIFLNWRMAVAGRSARAEAHGWLVREGLVAGRP